MKPDISEFSYGYAITEELVAKHKATIVGAPIFPSLYEEGKKGGGYDVQIPIKGNPVFLQFKLSDYLTKTSAKEHKSGKLKVPYYRMHLRPLKHSHQHELLLDLESTGESVLYIAPEFHLPPELNNFYLHKSVLKNSAAFKPSSIGNLPSNDEHYVAFEKSASFGFLCSSDPKEIVRTSLSDGLRAAIPYEARFIRRNDIITLAEKMLDAIERRAAYDAYRAKADDLRSARLILSERDPVEAIGFIALNFLGCALVIVE